MKLYVGNLSFDTNDAALAQVFGTCGEVNSATVLMDRETGRSRGFGFVEMNDEDAKRAIETIDGTEVDGRTLKVSEAKPREARSGGGGRW